MHERQFGVEGVQQIHQENWAHMKVCSSFCASLFKLLVPGISCIFFFLWLGIFEFHTAVVQLTGY